MRTFIIVICLLLPVWLRSASYFYPIATCQTLDGLSLCYIQQQSLSKLSVWFYNLTTHEWQQGLWSQYTPAGVRFCPGKAQFSFVDRGRIRVHSLLKRSPRSLEFQEPMYEIGIPEWADEEHLYFSAKKQQVSGIFQTDMQGSITPLLWDGNTDYLYPQKIDDQLFAIKRLKDGTHDCVLVRIEYGHNGEPLSLYQDQNSMAFLHMISQDEGFFIRCLGSEKEKTVFGYYHLIARKETWHSKQLFTFSVPTSLLTGQDRLYESILPLLPRYYTGILYYADCDETDHLALYTYHMSTQQKQMILSVLFHCFAPLVINNKLYHSI